MIGVLIVTHSPLADALLESSKMIGGDDIENCKTLTLTLGEDLEAFSDRFVSLVDSLNDGDGVLVLADLFAGTPANIAMRNMKERNFECISGVNLGMLLEVLSARNFMSMEELKKTAIHSAQLSIVDIGEKLFGGAI